jgi:hypothetical protein
VSNGSQRWLWSECVRDAASDSGSAHLSLEKKRQDSAQKPRARVDSTSRTRCEMSAPRHANSVCCAGSPYLATGPTLRSRVTCREDGLSTVAGAAGLDDPCGVAELGRCPAPCGFDGAAVCGGAGEAALGGGTLTGSGPGPCGPSSADTFGGSTHRPFEPSGSSSQTCSLRPPPPSPPLTLYCMQRTATAAPKSTSSQHSFGAHARAYRKRSQQHDPTSTPSTHPVPQQPSCPESCASSGQTASSHLCLTLSLSTPLPFLILISVQC